MEKNQASEQIARRIASKDKRDYNFMRESQAAEMESNNEIVVMVRRLDRGIETVDLTLEPNKFDQLSSKVRLDFEEYCEVINALIDEEEKEWDELRMKDQVNITRDAIVRSTMLKYANDEYGIKKEEYEGTDINFLKRYDTAGRFLGEAITLTLTMMPKIGVKK